MQRSLLFIIVVLLCTGCGVTLKNQHKRQQLNTAQRVLDSLNRVVTINDIRKEIQKIDDNSRIRVTKYSPPDSTGEQAIDYVVEIEKDISKEEIVELVKDEVQTENLSHKEENTDKSVIDSSEKYDEPAAVKGIKHIKGIVALILIAYVIYKFRKD